jgi:hypothetical protein
MNNFTNQVACSFASFVVLANVVFELLIGMHELVIDKNQHSIDILFEVATPT